MSDCKWVGSRLMDYVWRCEPETTYTKQKDFADYSLEKLLDVNVKQGNFWSALWCSLGEGQYNWNSGVCDWSHLQDTYQIKRWR